VTQALLDRIAKDCGWRDANQMFWAVRLYGFGPGPMARDRALLEATAVDVEALIRRDLAMGPG